MRRLAQGLALVVAMLALGFLAAACGSGGTGPIASFSPTRSIGSPTGSISVPSRSAAPSPSASSPATVTAQPSAASAPAAQPGSPAGNGDSGSSLVWLWIALGAVFLIVVIVLITRSAGRRSSVRAGWRSRASDAYAQGSALYDAMSAAETGNARAAGDAAARWFDIERRADDLARTLYALREDAPSEEDRARLDDTLASLQAARSAMSAERTPGGAGERQAGIVRDRLLSFEASLLRSLYDHSS